MWNWFLAIFQIEMICLIYKNKIFRGNHNKVLSNELNYQKVSMTMQVRSINLISFLTTKLFIALHAL